MEFQDYLQNVKLRYNGSQRLEYLSSEMFYEELFKVKWIATKLKQYSFLSFEERIDKDTIEAFSEKCVKFSIDQYKGLPRGLQNGVVSFNVLAGNEITQDAIDFAYKRPERHFAAFEMPIIADLKKETLYYYIKTPMWGMIYYKHFRKYISQNFALK